jgi:hypothetical protein
VETLGVQIRRHESAVGQARLHIQFVENLIEVGRAAGFFRGVLAFGQPLGVLGLEVVVGITEQRFGRGDEFGIVVAQAQDAALIRRSGHGVYIGVIGKARMGMVVIERYDVNFAKQVLIELLHVDGGIGAGLPGGRSCRSQGQQGNTRNMKQTFHSGFLLSRKAMSQAA